jgi:Uma2 family endonuclease
VSQPGSRRCSRRSFARVFPGAPDLAVEVVSPSNAPAAIHAKVADYLAAGTRLVWVVDTEEDKIDVYRTLLAPRTTARGETLSGEDVVPGFEAAVDEVFDLYGSSMRMRPQSSSSRP